MVFITSEKHITVMSVRGDLCAPAVPRAQVLINDDLADGALAEMLLH